MKDKKTILYISDSSEMDLGGQVSLFNLIKRIDRSRFFPVAICPETGPLVDHLKENDCQVHLMAVPRVKLGNLLCPLKWILGLNRVLSRNEVDVVHTDRPRTTFIAALLCILRRIPVVWHARVSASDPLFDRINLVLVSRVIGVSHAVGSRFVRRGRLSPKYRTIHNGVDCDKFQPGLPSGRLFRKEIGVGDSQCVIGTVAQIIPKKGIQEFVQAARRALRKRPDIHFVIVGRGDIEFTRQLMDLIRQERLDGRIRMAGYRNDILSVLPGLDIFVLASWPRVEGLPRAVIEAMACGKPVVGTRVEGISETVENGVTGLLVPPKAPEILASAILRLANDPELGRRMGLAGRRRCEKLFSVDSYVRSVEKVYEEI